MNGKPLHVTEERVPVHESTESIWATLVRPEQSDGVVVFAHGSGSSRFSPRNRFVADRLVRAGFTTVLADLLTEPEEAVDAITSAYRFDIALLASRLATVTRHVRSMFDGIEPIGYFGASTGAAAALIVAAETGSAVSAVVSRGGRPDLAEEALAAVTAPTLLIVGGEDRQVIELNRRAQTHMHALCKLVVVPGATHLFEEPGALEVVADLSADWFGRYLRSSVRRLA